MSDGQPVTVQLADDAYEAVRAINHATISRPDIPAPEVYSMLGSLKLLGGALDQALRQLGVGLAGSLDAHDVYQDDGSDPLPHVLECVDALTEARQHAVALGRLLEHAQGTISRQGYRDHEPTEEAEAPAHDDDPDDPLACMRCRVGAPLPHRHHDPACSEHRGA